MHVRPVIKFGPLEFDPAAGLLYQGDQETLLPPKAAGVLHVLLENSDQLVTKDELLEKVWAGAYVTESSLTDAISLLRQVLGDDSRDPTYIQTLHRRGYRFIAPVEQQAVADSGEGGVEGAATPSVEPIGEARVRCTGDWTPGDRLGNYEILDTLGAGAMGTVYRARDESLEREVAIKALPVDFANDPERVARLEREAKLLASVSHPNIATIHSLEESDGIRYPVFELVEGETLEQRLRSGRLPVDEALELGRQVASALEAAGAVDCQRFLQASEHASIVHDQTIHLFGKDSVGAGDGLHKSVISHGLVEIDGRARRHVEARHPHCTDEYHPESILRVLEFRLQVLGDHPLAVRPDVEALLLHLGDFVLALGDHHRHIGLFHPANLRLDPSALHLRGNR